MASIAGFGHLSALSQSNWAPRKADPGPHAAIVGSTEQASRQTAGKRWGAEGGERYPSGSRSQGCGRGVNDRFLTSTVQFPVLQNFNSVDYR